MGDTLHKMATGVHALMQYQDRLARATAKIRTAQVSKALRRCVVKIPTEWSRDDFDKRWGWLKVDDPDQRPANVLRTSVCLSDEAYGRLKRHHEALAFWEDAQAQGLALDKVHYHFHPLQFIEEFRKCGWLSAKEMVQMLPATGLGLTYDQALSIITVGQHRKDKYVVPTGMHRALNLVRRKYYLETPLRTAHFWGQIVQETDGFQTVREYASGADYENQPGTGNTEDGDGPRFRGRGVIQLTGRANYGRYGKYRRRDVTHEPHQLLLEKDAYSACDASGFYWASERTRDRFLNPPSSGKKYRWLLDGLTNISTRADIQNFQGLSNDINVAADVLNVTLQINRAALHLQNRIKYFSHAYQAVSDDAPIILPEGSIRP